jgi:hypothetical protein
VLVDGWHRVKAAGQAGLSRLPAVIVNVSSAAELSWLAAEANRTHGQPLERSLDREVFRRYVAAKRNMKKVGRTTTYRSYREIREDLGGIRSPTTLMSWMREDFPKIAREMGENSPGVSRGPKDALDFDTVFLGKAHEALITLANASKGLSSDERRSELATGILGSLATITAKLSDEGRRGEVIERLEVTLAELKALPHRLPPPPDF